MRKTEKILVCMAVIGLIMKLCLIGEGELLLVLSLTALALIYFVLSFALLNNIGFRKMFRSVNYADTPRAHVVVAMLCGFVLGLGLIGILFNVQHWPGSGILRYVLAVPILAINVIGLIMTIQKLPLGKRILFRSVPILLLDIFFILKCIFMF